MSIQSEIERINNNVQSTLNTIAETGVEVGTNSDALPAAAAALTNEKLNKNQGADNAGKLLYVNASGEVEVLTLGAGLEIVDGVISMSGESTGGETEVHIGETEPTDDSATIWINPNGDGTTLEVLTVNEVRAICT